MRVLVWTRAFLPASETFIRAQSDALRGWDVSCAGLTAVESPLRRAQDLALYGTGPLDSARAALALRAGRSGRIVRLLAELRPDVVHAHFASAAYPLLRAVERARVPLIVTVHGHDVTAALSGGSALGRWLRKRRVRAVLRRADQVVAVSSFIAARAIEAGAPAERVTVRYIGTDVEVPLAGDDEERDVIFVGRLVEKKGVGDLIDALAVLADRGIDVSATVVGDGPMRATLEKRVREQGLRVEFVGSRRPAEVRDLLARSRMFVGPSKTAPNGDAEGFGMVFIEAAAAGLPVIAYRHGGVVEAVADERTGLLAPEGDIEQLAGRIARLLDDDELCARMGAAGRMRARSEFDLMRNTAALAELYASFTRDGHGRVAGAR
ncbi:glycosyltransferase [Demequina iriomotensis]|uniref:glycosyltransferase n=1 Tax=Demequina iriomotensis TaxID=1536641 RepID=UPI000AD2D4F4|nr:glycosyltransferase [Demequina iriomotensis]